MVSLFKQLTPDFLQVWFCFAGKMFAFKSGALVMLSAGVSTGVTFYFKELVKGTEVKHLVLPIAAAYRGRNMERGYIYWDTTVSAGGERAVWSFFHTQIHFNAMHEVMRAIKKWSYAYTRIDDFEDYLTGLSQFIYNEYIKCADVIWGGKCGFEYGYQMYSTRAEVLAGTSAYKEIIPYPASRPYVWYYARTGVDKQDIADKAATWSGKNKRQSSDLQEQSLMYQHIHHDIIPDVTITPTVTNNGGGSYTLSWTVPSGVSKYKIKYSTKQIVDWLGYNRDTKTYQYSPSSYSAFFAATNVSGEPVPGTVGEIQSVTLTGLPLSGINFAMIGTNDAMIYTTSGEPLS